MKREKKLKREDNRRLSKLRKGKKKLEADTRKKLKSTLAKEHRDISIWKKALAQFALDHHGVIYRDFHHGPHVRQPDEINRVTYQKAMVDRFDRELKASGRLRWKLSPQQRNIAGWPWVGWQQSFEIDLPTEHRVRSLWLTGTRELGGSPQGVTLSSLRYRGLGRIEHELEVKDGAVANAFTTTEILPGAASGAPLISPIVPVAQDVRDRGYALQHRAGAWIAQMSRGAGHPFVDHQYSPRASLAIFHERQGNLRAMVEALPGDRSIGHTDVEYFGRRSKHQSIPQNILVLSHPKAFSIQERRSRWHEMDQYVRDQVSEAMGFQPAEARPAIGYNFDYAWSNRIAGATKTVPTLAQNGVRLVMSHHPGWLNGRGMRESKHPDAGLSKGGDCSIWDWNADPSNEKEWARFGEAMAQHGMAYLGWVSAYAQLKGPFWGRIGRDDSSAMAAGKLHGSEEEMMAFRDLTIFQPHHKAVREEWKGSMLRAAKHLGLNGFWIDSFQSNMMNEFSWWMEGEHEGSSIQEGWWELLSELSRENGMVTMAESHAFPGLSCSIEVPDWEKDFWYFVHVVKWMRGPSQHHVPVEVRQDLAFKLMMVKGWLALEGGGGDMPEKIIPGFSNLANAFNEVVADMRRPYVLPEDAGMLWLPFDDDDRGVLFTLKDLPLPHDLHVEALVGSAKEGQLTKKGVYRVNADHLLSHFKVAQPPLPDPRQDQIYRPDPYQLDQLITSKP